MMDSDCDLCIHERMDEANADIRSGIMTMREISEKYRVSWQTVRVHREHILVPETIPITVESTPPPDGALDPNRFISKLVQQHDTLSAFLDLELKKRSKRSMRTISVLSREIRQTIELLIKVAVIQKQLNAGAPVEVGELPPAIARAVRRLFDDPDVKSAGIVAEIMEGPDDAK